MTRRNRVEKTGLRMKNEVVLTVTLLLIGSVFTIASDSTRANASTSGTTASGPITQAWLDQQLAAWKPVSNASLHFDLLYGRASYGSLEQSRNTLGVQQADLTMLFSSDASCIRIDLGYAPWLTSSQKYINEMTSLVQEIKSAGKCLVIADAASETYWNSPIPWAQFKQAWIQRVTTLASLYKPDYYIVIKEPGWYFPMISDLVPNVHLVYSPKEWGSLTSSLANAVKSVSPNTKVGVSVAAYDLYNDQYSSILLPGQQPFNVQFLQQAEKIPAIDFIGFDIYGITDFSGTQEFLTQVGSGGKAVWIAEAWSGPFSISANPSRAQLDKTWVLVLYYFAQHIHAQVISPFFSDFFADYTLPNQTNPSTIISLFQNRTPVFWEYQSLAKSHGLSG